MKSDWQGLLAWVVVLELVGMGVFFAALLGMTVSNGGTYTIDMTQYGEMWIEYWIMLILMALAPWALWYVTTVEQ